MSTPARDGRYYEASILTILANGQHLSACGFLSQDISRHIESRLRHNEVGARNEVIGFVIVERDEVEMIDMRYPGNVGKIRYNELTPVKGTFKFI